MVLFRLGIVAKLLASVIFLIVSFMHAILIPGLIIDLAKGNVAVDTMVFLLPQILVFLIAAFGIYAAYVRDPEKGMKSAALAGPTLLALGVWEYVGDRSGLHFFEALGVLAIIGGVAGAGLLLAGHAISRRAITGST